MLSPTLRAVRRFHFPIHEKYSKNSIKFSLQRHSYAHCERISLTLGLVQVSVLKKIVGHRATHDNENENYYHSSMYEGGLQQRADVLRRNYRLLPHLRGFSRKVRGKYGCSQRESIHIRWMSSSVAGGGKRFPFAQELLDPVWGYPGAEQISLHLVTFEHTQQVCLFLCFHTFRNHPQME